MLDVILPFLKDMGILAVLSLMAAIVIMPIVFILGFIYDMLKSKHPNMPGFLIIFLCTFLGIFVGAFLLYIYISFSTQINVFG